jgi:hypothetical protein
MRGHGRLSTCVRPARVDPVRGRGSSPGRAENRPKRDDFSGSGTPADVPTCRTPQDAADRSMEHRDVAKFIIAAAALAALLAGLVLERRRRARRTAEALERARRRHRHPPLVSANLRGRAVGPDGDLWSGELRERSKAAQAAPSSRDR